MDEQEYRKIMNELEAQQENIRRRKRKKEENEEIYWDIRRRLRELVHILPEHWRSSDYFRTLDEFEEELSINFRKIDSELSEEEEQIEKERKELIQLEEAYRYEYQKENLKEA